MVNTLEGVRHDNRERPLAGPKTQPTQTQPTRPKTPRGGTRAPRAPRPTTTVPRPVGNRPGEGPVQQPERPSSELGGRPSDAGERPVGDESPGEVEGGGEVQPGGIPEPTVSGGSGGISTPDTDGRTPTDRPAHNPGVG